MRNLPDIMRLLICSLLLGGYGAMYAGSVTHELAHNVADQDQAGEHQSCDSGLDHESEDSHPEVSCFFCTHAPVLATSHSVEQVWSPAVATLPLPIELTQTLYSNSLPLPELRGPPTA